jgi:hypothetical protein
MQSLPVVESDRLVGRGLHAWRLELVQRCRDGSARRGGSVRRLRLDRNYLRLFFLPGVARLVLGSARLLLHGEGFRSGRDLLCPAETVPPAKLGVPQRIGVPAGRSSELVLRHD